jgi:capsid protein
MFWKSKAKEETQTIAAPQSSAYSGNRNAWVPARTEYFDGEKTPGELGYIRNYLPNYPALRLRAYSAELKSDLIKIITGKFFKFIVGAGLKLQAEPSAEVLLTEGITLTDEQKATFRKQTEARFEVYASSKRSSYEGMQNLHAQALDAFKTSFLGGDCLCIMRVDDDFMINIQVIEGQHIKTPFLVQEMMTAIKERGNTVKHGVELDSKGCHVAYYVNVEKDGSMLGNYERIPAKGEESGKTLAWMIYGSKHRIDHVRGVPVITQILEKVDKLDRYTEAAVGSAEERAKIVFAIEHSKDSDGENPLIEKMKQARGLGHNAAEETSGYQLGEKTAETIAATTTKQTFNMPIGASLKALDSNAEMDYGPFSKAVFYFMCASVEIPPEVALQLYEQNYSSSRAAINAWDYIVKIWRKKFAENFYHNFYNLWLEFEILKNKIQAPGYVTSMRDDNFMAIEAWNKARFTGANMPHIDPLKEVKAIREMLGKDNSNPLISHEQGAEMLGLGDWEKNNEKYKEEIKVTPEQNEPINSQNRQPDGTVDGESAV